MGRKRTVPDATATAPLGPPKSLMSASNTISLPSILRTKGAVTRMPRSRPAAFQASEISWSNACSIIAFSRFRAYHRETGSNPKTGECSSKGRTGDDSPGTEFGTTSEAVTVRCRRESLRAILRAREIHPHHKHSSPLGFEDCRASLELPLLPTHVRNRSCHCIAYLLRNRKNER